MNGRAHEDLLKRLFVCTHATALALREEEQFHEWTAMEVFALRAFQRVPNHALGAKALATAVHCSVPYASKLMKRMHARGLLEQTDPWWNFRSMVLTEKGLARLGSDAECLDVFARTACDGISDEDCQRLLVLFGRIFTNVRARSRSTHFT